MTEEIWNLPAGTQLLECAGSYCALGKIALALGHTPEQVEGCSIYTEFDHIIGEKDPCESVYAINDRAIDKWVDLTQQQAHELAIRTGIEMLLAAGCTLETDDTVSKELARLKSCAEVV